MHQANKCLWQVSGVMVMPKWLSVCNFQVQMLLGFIQNSEKQITGRHLLGGSGSNKTGKKYADRDMHG